MAEGFCTYCGYEVESFDNLECCPFCGGINIPCSYDNQVNISVNWHELHLLTVWAEHYANSFKEKYPTMVNIVYSIAHRLEKQFPEKHTLTLAGELSGLKREFPSAKINYPGVE